MGRIIEPLLSGSIPAAMQSEASNQLAFPFFLLKLATGADCARRERARTTQSALSVARGEAQDGPNHRTAALRFDSRGNAVRSEQPTRISLFLVETGDRGGLRASGTRANDAVGPERSEG